MIGIIKTHYEVPRMPYIHNLKTESGGIPDETTTEDEPYPSTIGQMHAVLIAR